MAFYARLYLLHNNYKLTNVQCTGTNKQGRPRPLRPFAGYFIDALAVPVSNSRAGSAVRPPVTFVTATVYNLSNNTTAQHRRLQRACAPRAINAKWGGAETVTNTNGLHTPQSWHDA